MEIGEFTRFSYLAEVLRAKQIDKNKEKIKCRIEN
jgi:hypothetical protein